jgi:hypothetical protein
VDLGLAADGGSYCPAFALLDDATDDTLAAALGRAVTEGCPEPLAGETDPQWWTVTAMAGVATDDAGRPAHGDDTDVVSLGKGAGVLLVTDQAAACALTTGELLGDATALVLSFDLDEIEAVHPDWRRSILRRRVRSLTVELKGASWGAVGIAVAGQLRREPGARGAPVDAVEADELVARLMPAQRGEPPPEL